jgi:hypothetical protein
VGVLRGESVGIADGSFNMRRFERLSAAMNRHSAIGSLGHSDGRFALLSGFSPARNKT